VSRSPRAVAHALLGRIRRDDAYANLVLAHAGELDGLDSRDRALATLLVYGTLQMEGSLDAALAHVASKGEVKAPPAVLDALRMGAYQVLFTEIAEHAAVGETVETVTTRPAAKWRGLANAMLRALAREKEGFPWVDRADDPIGWLALTYGHPRWLVERLSHTCDEADLEALLAADNSPAPVHVRANTLKTKRDDLVGLLADRGYEAEATDLAPEGIVVHGPPGVWREPEAGKLFVVQDIGAMLAPRLLAPAPHERVLDMACGRCGKATHMAALMGDEGTIVGLDNVEAKIRECRQMAAGLGVTIIDARQADARLWTEGPGAGCRTGFDAVLLDAPCSGTGTMRRRAELRWRRTPDDIERLVELQRELIVAAASHAAPGGRLCYATCSVLREENEQVVTWFLEQRAGFDWRLAESVQLWPHRDGTDGHFAALLARDELVA
jgi:16S rRNA (cytosine967-C5)-methyltransferase